MERKYNKTPIIEALCEFQFVPSQPWDITIPGRIYEKIKDDFPEKRQQVGLGIQFRPTEKGLEHKIESVPPRMQFFSKEKTLLVQIGPDLLVVNRLKPYSTWHQFRPEILKHLKIYQDIVTPKGFKRIGLRYINKINIKSMSIKLEDYFNLYPNVPEDIPQMHTSFLNRIEIRYENNRDKMLLALGSTTPEDSNTVSMILDLDYILSKPEGIPLDKTEEWLENAHSSIYEVFESCIKEKCRILFKEVKK